MPVLEKTPLSDSLQDYLEAVYLLVRRDRVARMNRIAAHLGVGKSSATGAIQALAERGLVHYDPYQFITLTPQGEAAARRIVRRHGVLKDFLVKVLDVSEAEADAAACKMEHAIQGPVLTRFVRFLQFVEQPAGRGPSWAKAFREFDSRGAGGVVRPQGESL